jgi:hypothetical protein
LPFLPRSHKIFTQTRTQFVKFIRAEVGPPLLLIHRQTQRVKFRAPTANFGRKFHRQNAHNDITFPDIPHIQMRHKTINVQASSPRPFNGPLVTGDKPANHDINPCLLSRDSDSDPEHFKYEMLRKDVPANPCSGIGAGKLSLPSSGYFMREMP